MKTATEIQNAIDSIRYYSNRIKQLSREQINIDMQYQTVDNELCNIRFEALGAIHANCNWLDIYCDNIASNLKHATEQDKKFVIVGDEA